MVKKFDNILSARHIYPLGIKYMMPPPPTVYVTSNYKDLDPLRASLLIISCCQTVVVVNVMVFPIPMVITGQKKTSGY